MLDFLMHLGLWAIGAYVAFWGLVLVLSSLVGIAAALAGGLSWLRRMVRGRA